MHVPPQTEPVGNSELYSVANSIQEATRRNECHLAREVSLRGTWYVSRSFPACLRTFVSELAHQVTGQLEKQLSDKLQFVVRFRQAEAYRT